MSEGACWTDPNTRFTETAETPLLCVAGVVRYAPRVSPLSVLPLMPVSHWYSPSTKKQPAGESPAAEAIAILVCDAVSLAVSVLDQPLAGQVYPSLMPTTGDCVQPLAPPPVDPPGRLIVVALMVCAFSCSATGANAKYPIWIWSAVVAPKKATPRLQVDPPVTVVKSTGSVNTPAAVVGQASVSGIGNS